MLLAVLFVFALVRGVQWWEGSAEGFRLYKIQSTPVFDERWDVNYTNEDLLLATKALSQRYVYLGHGFQCYAFVSEDGKYVIKFFRHQRLRLPEFVMSLPSFPFFDEWRKSRQLELSRRQDHLLRSCKTSWDIARHETAMVMVHLNVTKGLFPTIQILDSLQNTYNIELDNYQFLLQRKAVHVKPTIAALMKEGKTQQAEECIDKIFSLFLECAKKGIVDTDGALVRKNNLGFFEDRAIYIDGGKLASRKSACTKIDFKKDIKRLRPLHKWLSQEYPQLAKYFMEAQSRAVDAVESVVAEAHAPSSPAAAS
jgi:hypothetical protein